MKNFILGVLVTVAAVPAVVTGTSIVSSLISGKTLDEAVVILADQIDLLSSRQDVNEARTNDLVATTTETSAKVEILSSENDVLKAKNAELETKVIENEKAIGGIIESTPPAPVLPVEIKSLRVEKRDYSTDYVVVPGSIVRLLSVRLYNEGNVPVTTDTLIFGQGGQVCELAELWVEAGNGKRLGSSRIEACEASVGIPMVLIIPAGESRDVVIMGQMINPFRTLDGKGVFSLTLMAIPAGGSLIGLPVTGYEFTASSTPK